MVIVVGEKAGANPTSTRLRQAIISNDIPLVERLLRTNPHLLHNPDFENKSNTSLHLAAQAGHHELVELLISLGHDASPEVTDYIYSSSTNNLGTSVNTDGRTPLHLASSNHHLSTIELICTQFPNTINRGDKHLLTPLSLASSRQSPNLSNTLKPNLRAPIQSEDVGAIETLLARGADVHSQDIDGNTCLHQACAWGNLRTARVLVQAGADPNLANFRGFKPESYSLTVAADVYFRNLVQEVEKMKVEERVRAQESRKARGGGKVRLVKDEEEDFYDPEEGRDRADSGRSYVTVDSGSGRGLGISGQDKWS